MNAHDYERGYVDGWVAGVRFTLVMVGSLILVAVCISIALNG